LFLFLKYLFFFCKGPGASSRVTINGKRIAYSQVLAQTIIIITKTQKQEKVELHFIWRRQYISHSFVLSFSLSLSMCLCLCLSIVETSKQMDGGSK
jgi:hypothetical protein